MNTHLLLQLGIALEIVLIVICSNLSHLISIPSVPDLGEPLWNMHVKDEKVYHFFINASQSELNDLQYRLKNRRSSFHPTENNYQTYSLSNNFSQKIADFWLNSYNWTARENFLNQYPHFKTKIQGLNIHFLHVKPHKTNGLKVLPLLLVHGWPSSIREFYEIISFLTTPQKSRNFVFEVIAPSLPGYGFSDAANRPGLRPPQMAVVFKNLMKRLEFDKFFVHGGVGGGIIASHMSILFPEHIIAMHSYTCTANSPWQVLMHSLKSFIFRKENYETLMNLVPHSIFSLLGESRYLNIQTTKSGSIGTALNDSPIGLAVYILEKLHSRRIPEWYTLEDKELSNFELEKLLDNVMIYWMTGSITTSLGYTKNSNKEAISLHRIPVRIPSGCSRFNHHSGLIPTETLKNKYPNLIHVADHRGGHFSDLQFLEVLSKDIYDFTEKVRNRTNKS